MPQLVRQRECSKGTERIDEQRVCPVERVDEAAVRYRGPSVRLHRATDLERELVEANLPVIRLDLPLARHAPERAVCADGVEAVIVDAHVRQVRRHPRQRPLTSEFEKLPLAGRVEL